MEIPRWCKSNLQPRPPRAISVLTTLRCLFAPRRGQRVLWRYYANNFRRLAGFAPVHRVGRSRMELREFGGAFLTNDSKKTDDSK
jgi:hypothetical protein